jgi:hypothetical protein
MRRIQEQGDALQDRFEDVGGRLQSRWKSGHEGVRGHYFVDEEAKRAAAKTLSASRNLPCYLRLKSAFLSLGLCVLPRPFPQRKDRGLYCDISTNCSSRVAHGKKKSSVLLGKQRIGARSHEDFLESRTVGRNSTVVSVVERHFLWGSGQSHHHHCSATTTYHRQS